MKNLQEVCGDILQAYRLTHEDECARAVDGAAEEEADRLVDDGEEGAGGDCVASEALCVEERRQPD